MSVGGQDVVLLAPAGECLGDVILRACRRHWPQSECMFQEAHQEAVYPLSEPWVWTAGTSKTEFSIYKDNAAVDSWRSQGAVKSNANTMFHFILGDVLGPNGLIEVAMVYDKDTKELRSFIRDLQVAFLSMTSLVSERGAA